MSNFEKIAEINKLVNGYPSYDVKPEYWTAGESELSVDDAYETGLSDGESLLADKIKQILNS